MASDGDTYVKVKGIFVHRTADAALIDFDLSDDPTTDCHWVSFSLMRGLDERKFIANKKTDVIEFSMFEWKAKKLGLE